MEKNFKFCCAVFFATFNHNLVTFIHQLPFLFFLITESILYGNLRERDYSSLLAGLVLMVGCKVLKDQICRRRSIRKAKQFLIFKWQIKTYTTKDIILTLPNILRNRNLAGKTNQTIVKLQIIIFIEHKILNIKMEPHDVFNKLQNCQNDILIFRVSISFTI